MYIIENSQQPPEMHANNFQPTTVKAKTNILILRIHLWIINIEIPVFFALIIVIGHFYIT